MNQKIFTSAFDAALPVALLFQAQPPPLVRSIPKPFKPGGYQDSGADIAFALRQMGVPVVTPEESPDPARDQGWSFPDHRDGIDSAIRRGAGILWANTVLYPGHPIQKIQHTGVAMIGQLPRIAELYDDKHYTNELLRSQGILIPTTIIVGDAPGDDGVDWRSLTDEFLASAGLTFPLIVKPIRGRGSQGVKKVDDLQLLRATAESMFADLIEIDGQSVPRYGTSFLLEQYLPGEELTITVAPPGVYRIDGVEKIMNHHWSLPPVMRTGHDNGVAPYSGVVAVSANSRIMEAERLNEPLIVGLRRACEEAAGLVGATAPVRIDCRLDDRGDGRLFDLNLKPNLTGAGRPGRDGQENLLTLAAAGIGWDYPELLWNILHQAFYL